MDDIKLEPGGQLEEAEAVMSEADAIEHLKDAEPQTRKTRILEIDALEILTPKEAGVELNEGYTFYVDGAIPQLADALAKMAIEMDKSPELGDNAGAGFITIISQFYEKLKSE